MRLLHTSDWHLGRRLHGVDLRSAHEQFLDHLVATVRDEHVDVVLHSGDVYDRSQPPVECLQLLSDTLIRLRDAGATTVMISGNHDAAGRLGDKAELLDARVRLRTDPSALASPVTVHDADGPVHIYGVPYLEPAAVGHLVPGRDAAPAAAIPRAGQHERVLRAAVAAVGQDRQHRGGRSVVLAHAWVVGGEATDSERDVSVGGLAQVPAGLFADIDYTALGHLHRPQALGDGLRYAGSPLAFSFSEAGQAKSSWLVELDATGLRGVDAVPVPGQRPLSTVAGELGQLLTGEQYRPLESHYLAVTVTDTLRPADAMARLQRRFPFAVTLQWCPPQHEPDDRSYRQRTAGRSELEIATSFVAHVRSAASAAEAALLSESLDAARLRGDAA